PRARRRWNGPASTGSGPHGSGTLPPAPALARDPRYRRPSVEPGRTPNGTALRLAGTPRADHRRAPFRAGPLRRTATRRARAGRTRVLRRTGLRSRDGGDALIATSRLGPA